MYILNVIEFGLYRLQNQISFMLFPAFAFMKKASLMLRPWKYGERFCESVSFLSHIHSRHYL